MGVLLIQLGFKAAPVKCGQMGLSLAKQEIGDYCSDMIPTVSVLCCQQQITVSSPSSCRCLHSPWSKLKKNALHVYVYK